jgi:hypothetical protein
MSQAGDDQLDCPALIEQIKANRSAAEAFLHGKRMVEGGNVAKLVAGAIFMPIGLLLPLIATDLSNEEQVKARSITDRNEWLLYLARSKGCTEP